MAVTPTPIFTQTPKNGFAKITGVDGSADGTDADVQLVHTAHATNGGFLTALRVIPLSTSGLVVTSAAALRIYLNNGSTVGTASNNQLIFEYTLPITSTNVSATAAAQSFILPLMLPMEAGFRIYAGVTAMTANSQWNVTAIAGDY